MITEQAAETGDRDLDHLLTTIGHHFGRVEPRRRMRDYVRALLAPVARKDSRQLAEHAGHVTPDGLQHLLSRARWNPDDIRDDLQTYVAEHLGRALMDRELYLPKSWTDDRDRCHATKVPDQREFATKNTLAATIVRRALASPLPIAWVTADAAYGQDNRFRRMLETRRRAGR